MSADPRRITNDNSLSELFDRVRALERAQRGALKAVYLVNQTTLTAPDTGVNVGFDLQGGIAQAGAPALTNDEQLFSTDVMTGGVLAGKHGLKITETGLYGAFSNITTISPDESGLYVPAQQSMGYGIEGTGSFSQSGTFNFGGDFDQAVYGRQDVFELWSIGADTLGDFVSQTIGLYVANGRGAGTGDVDLKAGLWVFQWPHDDISQDGTLALY